MILQNNYHTPPTKQFQIEKKNKQLKKKNSNSENKN